MKEEEKTSHAQSQSSLLFSLHPNPASRTQAYTYQTVTRLNPRPLQIDPVSAHSTIIGAGGGRTLLVAARSARTASAVSAIQPSHANAIIAVSTRQGARFEQKERSGQMLCGVGRDEAVSFGFKVRG